MSEYRYYEFRAVDRPLTQQDMRAMRLISTRAAITSTSFSNDYTYGDLKADHHQILRRYFDASSTSPTGSTSRSPSAFPRGPSTRTYCAAMSAMGAPWR